MKTGLETHREWARLGAAARLAAIDRERAEILAAFPDLRHGLGRSQAAAVLPVAPRRRLSAAGRRALSEGMRKYWAARKKAERKAKQA